MATAAALSGPSRASRASPFLDSPLIDDINNLAPIGAFSTMRLARAFFFEAQSIESSDKSLFNGALFNNLHLGSKEGIEQARADLRTDFTHVRDAAWSSTPMWLANRFFEVITRNNLEAAYLRLDTALVAKVIDLRPTEEDISQKDFNDAENLLDPKQFPSPDRFKFGVGTCEYQVSGRDNCPDSQWAHFEPGHVREANLSGKAANHWNLSLRDIELLRQLGVNSYRFSVEWSLIEPKEGEFNQEAIDHYVTLCLELRKAGIEPTVTLHHFTHPQWFEEKGAFANEANIKHIVAFSEKMYDALHPYVNTWYTINEPNIYAQMGYHGVFGSFPPGRVLRIGTMMQVLCNLFKAHDRIYDALHAKALAEGHNKPSIGIIHQMLRFQAKRRYDPIRFFADYMSWMFSHDRTAHFLRSGEFKFWAPGFGSVSYTSDKPRHDFIGVNYYTVPLLQSGNPPCTTNEGEVLTDMDFRTHPTGLYTGLKEMATLGYPLMVTENGIADSEDSRRARYIQENLYACQKAIEDGVDLRGYFHWAFLDNSEWEHGIKVKNFGLFAVNWDTFERKLRDGAQPFIDFIAIWRKAS